MANIKIQDVFQRIQYTASSPSQSVFAVPFPFFNNNDVRVYQDDTLLDQGSSPGEYAITGAGSPSGGTVTLVTPATAGTIITIQGALPIDRTSIYSPTISNLTGTDLNNDFNREIVMLKQLETTQKLLQLQYAPYAEVSQDPDVTKDRWIPQLSPRQTWRMNAAGTAIEGYLVPDGDLAPADATYLLQTANSFLPNAQVMGSLPSGFVVNTTSTGVQLTRSLTGRTNQIDVQNPTGIAANPEVFIRDNPIIPGTAGMGIPAGTTAQRVIPTPPSIGLRWNTDIGSLEFYDATLPDWVQLESSADIVNLIARLAAHTAGDGASMIGLEDQGTVSNKTVQDLAEMSFVTVNDDTGTLLNSQQLSALALLLTGGTMAGNIDMNNNNINNLPLPSSAAQPATKGYVDGIAFNTHPACNFGTTANLAGYTYDNGSSGVGATLTAGSNGAFSTDGQNPSLNDRILVLNQTNPAENGIYVLSQVGDISNPAILTRATDYDEPDDIQAGDEVAVVGGDTLAGSKWMMTQTTTPIVIGTTDITWVNIAIPTDVMTLSGAQTATGAKTFDELILSGDMNADSNKIINLLDPTNAQDAATKAYVDALTSKVVQYVVATSAVDDTSTSQTLANSSLTASITPTSTSNRIVVVCYAPASFTTSSIATNYAVRFDIRRTTGSATTISGTPSGALAGHIFSSPRANDISQNIVTIIGTEIAPDTNSNTYVLRFARLASSGTATIAGASRGPALMLILELKV